MKMKLAVAVLATAVLAGCASSGARLATVSGPSAVPAPVAEPAPEWTDSLFDIMPGNVLVSVGFSEPWMTDEATVLAATLNGKLNLLHGLYGEEFVAATGKFLKEHPLKGDMEEMSLSERFLKDVAGTFSTGRLKTFQRKVWRDTAGVKLKPGTLFVQVVYMGNSMDKAFQSADDVLDQYRKKLSLNKEAEVELDGLLDKLEQRKNQLKGGGNEKLGGV